MNFKMLENFLKTGKRRWREGEVNDAWASGLKLSSAQS